MKSFVENFRELDIDELLQVNGGYGSSSGGGYGNSSGSYEKVTTSTSSGNQSSWDVWIANKDGRDKNGNITRPHNPYSDTQKASGDYDKTSFMPYHTSTSGGDDVDIPKDPFYMQQREFSSLYGNDFGNTACAATSLLNEISERYTLETGLVMTEEQAVAAMQAAVNSGHVGSAENGCAYIEDWEKQLM